MTLRMEGLMLFNLTFLALVTGKIWVKCVYSGIKN